MIEGNYLHCNDDWCLFVPCYTINVFKVFEMIYNEST